MLQAIFLFVHTNPTKLMSTDIHYIHSQHLSRLTEQTHGLWFPEVCQSPPNKKIRHLSRRGVFPGFTICNRFSVTILTNKPSRWKHLWVCVTSSCVTHTSCVVNVMPCERHRYMSRDRVGLRCIIRDTLQLLCGLQGFRRSEFISRQGRNFTALFMPTWDTK